jgi:phycocyanin-associated, rod
MGGKIVKIEPLHTGAKSGDNGENPFTNEFE